MRKIIFFFYLITGLLMSNFTSAQTVLTPGDVMLTGINAGNSELAFVTWVTLQPGTKICFTNNGWNSTGITTSANNARNVEEIATWTNSTATGIPTGSIIVTKAASPYTANIGTTTVFSNTGAPNPMLKIQDGDQITIYQPASGNGYSSNNSATATFNGKAIGINNWLTNYLTSGTVSNATSYLPSDLTSLSVFHSTPFLNPYIHYIGARNGLSAEGYKPLVMDNGNWQNDWASPLNATAFSFGVLPLRLVMFTAQQQPSGIELNWLTAREVDFLRYDVEYSSNAITFFKIGEVAANPTAGERQYYFQHHSNTGFNHYYRLKMIDKDGSFTYSSTEKVRNALITRFITVKPNPVVDQRIIVATNNLPKNKYLVQLSNGFGNILYKQFVNITGREILSIRLPSLAAGIYHLQVGSDDVRVASTVFVK